jgi:hypothetical protein
MIANEVYTTEVLAVVCPSCKGVNRCLEPSLWGSKYIDKPHAERVALAAQKLNKPVVAGPVIAGIKTACIACSEQGRSECLYGGPCDRVKR